jgi:pilus assembly protein CpaF
VQGKDRQGSEAASEGIPDSELKAQPILKAQAAAQKTHAQGSRSMATLTIVNERFARASIAITGWPVRIGRQSGNEVVLPSWRVARVHAEIHHTERGLELIDQSTRTGTWVNGDRVTRYGPIRSFDEIRIGGFRLSLQSDDERLETALPKPPDPALLSGSVDDHKKAAEGVVSMPSAKEDPPAPEAVLPAPVFQNDGGAASGKARIAPDGGRDGGTMVVLAEHPSTYWRLRLHARLLQSMDLREHAPARWSEHQLRDQAGEVLTRLLAEEPKLPPNLDTQGLVREILDEVIGLGPLQALLADPEVSEIMVNAPDEVFVERRGRLHRSTLAFTSEQAVRAVLERIVAPLGRRIDEASPMVDARLPDGSRVNAVIPPLAVRGTALTIRRFGTQVLKAHDLLGAGSASAPMLEFLRVCIALRRNIIISGGTGSGKTTLLNLLSNLIDPGERIVTIEDAAELQLGHVNRVCLEARPANAEGRGQVTIRDLVRNALRMRPDRIIVGECRGGEALDMLQAMNSGHDGSLTTLHANASRDVFSRLETMALMSGIDLPVAAVRDQIASAVDIVVHQSRLSDGRRRIVEIVEVTGIESGTIQTQTLFRFRKGAGGSPAPAAGRFQALGIIPRFYEQALSEGQTLDLKIFSPDD